ncbi:MAG: N-acetylmuramoyl-L-alanine amidase-like domain-containing protein [Verrucomicrobiales bacterium]
MTRTYGHPMTRRHFVFRAAAALATPFAAPDSPAIITLPKELCFRGEETFHRIVDKAVARDWGRLPMGQRLLTLARELEDVPYVGFTLEIHDRIECPSVDFGGLDCWTFFETVLGLARMIETPKPAYSWTDLLAEIEWTRYRGGRCTGGYLERIHYLDEWFFDNFARQNIHDLTRRLPGAVRLHGRRSTEMTNLWKSYRYLRENPSLRAPMRQSEREVENLPVWYIPKTKVPAIEPQLQSGDIIGIVTRDQGGVCSHVGLAARDADGTLRFIHASKNHKAVVMDSRLSVYLNRFKSHAGILAGRPLSVRYTLRDPVVYQARLARLKAGLAPNAT